jgi:hypothetical protein
MDSYQRIYDALWINYLLLLSTFRIAAMGTDRAGKIYNPLDESSKRNHNSAQFLFVGVEP